MPVGFTPADLTAKPNKKRVDEQSVVFVMQWPAVSTMSLVTSDPEQKAAAGCLA